MALYEDNRLKFALAADVFQRLPDPVIVVDASGRIRMVNERASLLTGYPESDLLHRPIEDLVPEQLRAAHEQYRASYIQDPHTRAMGAGLRLELVQSDGARIPVEINLAWLSVADGNFAIATVRRLAASPGAAQG